MTSSDAVIEVGLIFADPRFIGFAFMTLAASQIAVPVCKHCDVTMVLVGKLPSVQQHPEIRVFRCYVCNHVASEQA